jgi:RND family efflux transporter MFP subunit
MPLSLALAFAAGAAGAAGAQAPGPQAQPLKTVEVRRLDAGSAYFADGQVEALRETVIAAQVSGRVVTLAVKAGDPVRAGQVLLRIDARAAEQNQAASAAQLAAAKAQLTAADRHLERTRQLVAQKFLSPSTLDKAEADQRAAAETVKALTAQTAGAATQTGWHTITAPFSGYVTSVATQLGDTALPGKPLLQLHDPSALRVAVNVPASVSAKLDRGTVPSIEIPDAEGVARRPVAQRVTVVPATDPTSHTQLVRLDLKPGIDGLSPGLFARVRLPLGGEAGAVARLAVPTAAVAMRGDLKGVYVVDEKGAASLRQVRLGRTGGDEVEVLSGLAGGERVALDPVAAARATPAQGGK